MDGRAPDSTIGANGTRGRTARATAALRVTAALYLASSLVGGAGATVGAATSAPAGPAAGSLAHVATTDAILVDPDGAPRGALVVGAPALVVALEADEAEIALEGWSMTAAPSVLLFAMVHRIPLARLTETGVAVREVLDERADAFGTPWQRVRLSGRVAVDHLRSDLGPLWDAAAVLYATACGACHAVHDTRAYTANQWPGAVQAMLPNVTLSDEELERIIRYLQYHAKDVEATRLQVGE